MKGGSVKVLVQAFGVGEEDIEKYSVSLDEEQLNETIEELEKNGDYPIDEPLWLEIKKDEAILEMLSYGTVFLEGDEVYLINWE